MQYKRMREEMFDSIGEYSRENVRSVNKEPGINS